MSLSLSLSVISLSLCRDTGRAREAQREKEEYAAQLRERQIRASTGPTKPFKGVEKRHQVFQDKREEKLDQLRKEQAQRDAEAREGFQKQLHSHIEKGYPQFDRSYEDMRNQEGEARRVRIEQRKTKLLMSSTQWRSPSPWNPKEDKVKGLIKLLMSNSAPCGCKEDKADRSSQAEQH